MLSSKQFADGSMDQWQYNPNLQLANYIAPGVFTSSFNYAGDGSLTSWSLNAVLVNHFRIAGN